MARRDTSSEYLRLALFLKRVRLDADLRQTDVAKRLRQPQSYVSKYESGERCLTLIELKQVCNALGMPLREFIKRFEGEIQ